MMNSPIQNTADFTTAWIHVEPKVTQRFGETPYSKTGAYGYVNEKPRPHPGIDFRANKSTKIFAPFDGYIRAILSDSGYGNHVRIRNNSKKLECILGHMSEIVVSDGYVRQGDLIGYAGTSGNSTGVHLHFGVRRIIDNGSDNIWNFPIKDYDSWLFGYFDPSEYIINWKGTMTKNSL